jgi:DNA polymerase-1
VGELDWEDFPTGVLFGFFEQFRTLCQDDMINSNRVVFFFDSRKSYRKKAFPDYKAKRRESLTEEERKQIGVMHDQLTLLRRDLLPSLGVQVHRQAGCESDDLMAQAANQLTDAKEPGIIVTADGDLWQCISEYVSWYDPARKRYLTPSSFARQKGIPPARWGLVKALAGCAGDGVPGIARVGEKTAVKFLLNQLPQTHKTYQAITSPTGGSIFSRNKELVLLPHEKTRAFELRSPDYKPEHFFSFCERYGFRSYLKGARKEEWLRFFGEKRTGTRKRGQLL